MQKIETDNRLIKYNCGISILKIWMVMSVVISHFFNNDFASKASRFFTIYGGTALSVLIFISFLLTNIADERNGITIKRRLYRLTLLHFFFSVLYFIVYNFMVMPTPGISEMREGEGVISLVKQLLFGAYLDPPMWFLVDLIILSILFYSIFGLLRDAERGIIAIVIVAGIAIYAQYSGMNYRVFGNLPNYSKWTLGRLAELVPLATLGIVLSHYKIMDKLLQHRKVALTISIIGLVLFHHTSLFYPVLDGFYYQGMQFIWLSVCLTVFFWCLPLEHLPVKIRLFFNKWSRYNMGIIAMHYMVKAFFDIIIGEVRRLSLQESLMVYIISLLISVAAVHIPVKFIKNSFV